MGQVFAWFEIKLVKKIGAHHTRINQGYSNTGSGRFLPQRLTKSPQGKFGRTIYSAPRTSR